MARTLDRLSVTLDKLLRARGLQDRIPEYRIFAGWERAVGPGIARHAQPRSVQRGKLAVVVDSPAWMQQLSLLSPEIMEKLNRELGRVVVRAITLKLGEVGPAHERSKTDGLTAVSLAPEERSKIERYIGSISDGETREAIRRVIEKDLLSRKRTRKED
jgi:hypothetical protein